MKVILTQIILKFIETVLKREFVKNVFVLQKLGKELILHLWLVLIGIEELIWVFFNHENKFTDHVGLRAKNVLLLTLGRRFAHVWIVTIFLVVWVVFGKISIHPHFDFTAFGDEDHFFDNIEIAYFLVKGLETIEGGLVHVEQILEGNIVDLFEP